MWPFSRLSNRYKALEEGYDRLPKHPANPDAEFAANCLELEVQETLLALPFFPPVVSDIPACFQKISSMTLYILGYGKWPGMTGVFIPHYDSTPATPEIHP